MSNADMEPAPGRKLTNPILPQELVESEHLAHAIDVLGEFAT